MERLAEQYSREIDFRFYLNNKEKLAKKYPDQYILLREEKLIGAFNSYNLAEEIARKMYPAEDFYIQHCAGK